MSKQMIFPMAFYVFYIFLLGLYVFFSRVRAVRSGQVSIKYFRTYQGTTPAEEILVIGRHYDNQFQVPIVFLITCLTHLVLGQADFVTLIFTWVFILSRLMHSRIHLGSNRVTSRAFAFVVGWVMIALLWVQILYFTLR